MSTLTVNLDPVAIREATSQAIMGLLTPELREKLIRDSIANLLNPSQNSWDRGKTPLQSAFNSAVEVVAQKIAAEYVAGNAEVVAKIRELMTAAMSKLVSVDAEKLTEKMGNAIAEAISRN